MIRAVNYCRVSTEEQIQSHSLSNQIKESVEAIAKNKWVHICSYIDEGKSGTTVKNRSAYKKLLEDMEKDKFDIIVVKSQDRLMRNIREWYYFIDRLIKNEKKLYFYIENEFYTPDNAFITGIKAILAEEYSRELSKKINNAHRNRQKSGSAVLLTSNTWGYDKKGKEVVVNEKEAEIVKWIYHLCLEGYGSRCIAKMLSDKGMKGRTGNSFSDVTVRRIIRNPLFKGTVVMNKKHIDFDTKSTVNVEQCNWIVHENRVPAIVSETVWQQANDMMNERCKIVKTEHFKMSKRGKNKGVYELSGKIYCGECGNIYWRRCRKTKKEINVVEWSCSEYVKNGRKKENDIYGCNNITVKNETIECILYTVAKQFGFDTQKDIIKSAITVLKQIMEQKQEIEYLQQQKQGIIHKRELLLDRHLDGDISLEVFKTKYAMIEQQYIQCCDTIEKTIKQYNDVLEINKRFCDIENKIQSMVEKELKLHKLLNHILKIEVFYNQIKIYFDVFEPIEIEIKESKRI